MQVDRPLVSACIIARNEQSHIGRCIAALRGFADEVLVLDTGSSDDTVETAAQMGALVFHDSWTDDFAYHRNRCMEHAAGEWILTIDADEEIVCDKETARQRLSDAGLQLPAILLVRGVPADGSEEPPTLLPRLFRRSCGFRYIHPIHEQLDVRDESAVLTDIKLVHHGFDDMQVRRAKHERNIRIAHNMGLDSVHGLHTVARSSSALGDWPSCFEAASRVAALSKDDGIRLEGLVMAAAAAVNLKRWEDFQSIHREAKLLAADDPDVAFLDVLAACTAFTERLAGSPLFACGGHWRPRTPFFHHYGARVARLLAGEGSNQTPSRQEAPLPASAAAHVREKAV